MSKCRFPKLNFPLGKWLYHRLTKSRKFRRLWKRPEAVPGRFADLGETDPTRRRVWSMAVGPEGCGKKTCKMWPISIQVRIIYDDYDGLCEDYLWCSLLFQCILLQICTHLSENRSFLQLTVETLIMPFKCFGAVCWLEATIHWYTAICSPAADIEGKSW